jgi:hypothetical protein
MHGDREAGPGCAPHDVCELFPRRDLDSGAVEQPSRARAEGAVHEGLDVADPEEAVAEPRADPGFGEVLELLRREGLPDTQRERALVAEALPDAERPQPAVLVVDGRDAARVGDADALAGGLHQLVLARADVDVAEVPGALLSEDAGRLAALVPLDDPSRYLEVAVGQGKGRGVEPVRVVVLRHQRHRDVARDGVERLPRRLNRRRPRAASPAESAQHPPGRGVLHGGGDPSQRVFERGRVLQANLLADERPGRKVDVGVVEPGHHAASAEVDPLRRC